MYPPQVAEFTVFDLIRNVSRCASCCVICTTHGDDKCILFSLLLYMPFFFMIAILFIYFSSNLNI